MNICFFYLPAIAPSRGGVERVTAVLADEFEKRGHHCFYLATLDENREVSNPSRQFFLPNTARTAAPENIVFYKQFLKERKIDIVVWQGAHKKFPFKKFNGHPPIVCALHLDPCAYEAIVRDKIEYSCSRKNRTLGTIARWIFETIIRTKIFFRRAKKKIVYRHNYSLCEKYVVLSPAFVDALQVHLRMGRDLMQKIVSIPNPISIVPVSKKTLRKEKTLLFVGRMCLTQKRPDLMLHIWARIEGKFPGWRLEMLGNGNDFDELKKLAQVLDLHHVKFRGFTDSIPFFEKSPILCMTSSNEGFGLVLIEAAAFGCVPIAFDSFAAVHDIISDGENGVLIPAFDLDKYAETLARLMSDAPERERIAKNALTVPEKFAPGKIVEQWLALFHEISSKK